MPAVVAEGIRAEVAGSALLAGLDEAGRDRILGAAVEKELPQKGTLFHQGDAAEFLHLVVSGRLKLTQVGVDGAEVIVRYIGPGEIVAGIVAFQDAAYPVSAVAVEPARLLVWDKPTVRELCAELPQLARNIMQVIGGRMRELQERFREIATQRVDQRLAQALLRLAEQSGQRTPEGVLLDQPLSRQDLAEMTGTTLFTASRTLSRWEREGIVIAGRQRVVVTDPERLRRIAEGPDGET